MIIGSGVQLSGGVQVISEISIPYVTNGLVMNLLTAPSSGTTWTDATGNGNNATIITSGSGTATYTSNYGGGITLGTAINSEAICTAYNLGTAFTVEIWAQPTAANYWATLWGNDIYSTKGYWAYWSSSASGILAGSPTGNILYSGITPNPGAIKHYVFTLTGSTFTTYLNGVAQTGSGSFASPSGGVSTTGLNFGSRHPNNTGTANTPVDVCAGTYYQMRVYNRALSSSEVTQNFNGSRGIFGV